MNTSLFALKPRNELSETLWRFRREFLKVGLLSFFTNMLLITPSIYIMQVYDRVMLSRSELTLLAVTLIALMLLGFLALAEWLRSRLLVRIGLRLDDLLSSRVFTASFDQSLGNGNGLQVRTFNDLTELRQFITGNGVFAFFDAPWSPIFLLILFLMHPVLGWASLVFALIQVLLVWFGHRRTVAPVVDALQAHNASNEYLQGKLRNTEALAAMGMLGSLRKHWQLRYADAMNLGDRAHAVQSAVSAWSKYSSYAQRSLMLGLGALLVIEGSLSPGSMIAANLLMTRVLAPIDLLVAGWKGFQGARDAYERLVKLLEQNPPRDKALGRMPPSGELVMANVSASIIGRKAPILQELDITLPPGTVTVVMGPSGSGKSTLGKLALGIWSGQQTGDVLLDGTPISTWDRSELGPALGYLPQDIELFDGTVAENIARMGEIDSEKVIDAAKSAGLHDLILRLPKGYDSQIGEAGAVLSGGQRQRVGLARAIYGQPRLVVLDEPNANLDEVGEAALVNAVRLLRERGCTFLIIAHRSGVVSVADRIVMLRDGRIVSEGPRDVVLAEMFAPSANARSAPPGAAQPAL